MNVLKKKKLLLPIFLFALFIIFIFPLSKENKLITFREENLGWEIKHRDDLKISSSPIKEVSSFKGLGNEITFWRDGQTQQKGTEFYDGLMVKIIVVKKDSVNTLKDFATENSKNTIVYPQITFPLTEIEVNKVKGYKSFVNEYGRSLRIFLPYKNLQDYALLITVVSEGKNKKAYDKEFQQMLESFRYTSY